MVGYICWMGSGRMRFVCVCASRYRLTASVKVFLFFPSCSPFISPASSKYLLVVLFSHVRVGPVAFPSRSGPGFPYRGNGGWSWLGYVPCPLVFVVVVFPYPLLSSASSFVSLWVSLLISCSNLILRTTYLL